MPLQAERGAQAKPVHASRGEDDRVKLAALELSQAGIYVAAQWKDFEIRPDCLELGLPPQAAGADMRRPRQFFQAGIVQRQEHVARVLPLWNGRKLETSRKLGGQVFQAVYRQINCTRRKGIFNFLGEHALDRNHDRRANAAGARQRDILNLVSASLDDLNVNFVAVLAQPAGNMIGLPQCELRATRADANRRHQSRVAAMVLDLS